MENSATNITNFISKGTDIETKILDTSKVYCLCFYALSYLTFRNLNDFFQISKRQTEE